MSSPPSGSERLLLGGHERVVGCWTGYELDRRRVAREFAGGREAAGAPSTVDDLLLSLQGGACGCPLRTPLGRAARTLAARLRAPSACAPSVAPAELEDLAASRADQMDVPLLVAAAGLAEDLGAPELRAPFDEALAVLRQLEPALPDDAAAAAAGPDELEEAVRPYAAALELVQGRLARLLELLAARPPC